MKNVTLVAAAMVALAALAHPAQAQTRAITCSSRGNGQTVCPAGTVAGARLVQQLSGTPCIRGNNWGFTAESIWVSTGCRAVFEVTQGYTGYGSGYNDRYDRYGRHNHRHDRYSDGNGSYTTEWNGNGAAAGCTRAVRSQLGRVNVTSEAVNNSRINPRIRWTASNGMYGSCRLSRQEGTLTMEVAGQR